MKSLAILSLLSLLSDAAVIRDRTEALQARQLDSILGFLGGLMSGPQKPLTTTTLSPEMDSTAMRVAKTYGPFTLVASNGTHGGTGLKLDANSDVFTSILTPVCTDCVVLQAQALMVYPDGTKADIGSGVYGHHILVTDWGRQMIGSPTSITCNGTTRSFGGNPEGANPAGASPAGTSPAGTSPAAESMPHSHGPKQKRQGFGSTTAGLPTSPFIGKGGDDSKTAFAAPNSTVKSGFYIGKNDIMMSSMEIVNYDPVPKELYLSLDFEYIPGRPAGYLDVGLGGIDVTGCGDNQLQNGLHPPTDRPITYTSPKWDVITDGYLLDIRPHLHDGAINVKVYKNDQLVCSSEAVYGGGNGGTTIDGQQWETITAYTPCLDAVPIKKGDKLSMTSEYDLTKHRLRPNAANHDMGESAMAIANFVFAKAA